VAFFAQLAFFAELARFADLAFRSVDSTPLVRVRLEIKDLSEFVLRTNQIRSSDYMYAMPPKLSTGVLYLPMYGCWHTATTSGLQNEQKR
jgi:hypothetical protein